MITSLRTMMRDAEKRKYAIGAFNTSNLEITQAIIRAAVAMKSPVIIQTSESAIKYAGLKTLYEIIKETGSEEAKKIPIAIHLDHGSSVDIVRKVLKVGYNSVMLDGSHLPYKQNVRETKRAVALGKKYKASVQGEIGALRGEEGWVSVNEEQASMTTPDEAQRFLHDTGIDTLAVSIGTMHGIKKFSQKGGVPTVNIKRLKEIKNEIGKTPIVLHGASGVKATELSQGIKNGIRIVNIDTEIRLSFSGALRKYLKEDRRAYDPRKILGAATEAVQKTVEDKMKDLGSIKKA